MPFNALCNMHEPKNMIVPQNLASCFETSLNMVCMGDLILDDTIFNHIFSYSQILQYRKTSYTLKQ